MIECTLLVNKTFMNETNCVDTAIAVAVVLNDMSDANSVRRIVCKRRRATTDRQVVAAATCQRRRIVRPDTSVNRRLRKTDRNRVSQNARKNSKSQKLCF